MRRVCSGTKDGNTICDDTGRERVGRPCAWAWCTMDLTLHQGAGLVLSTAACTGGIGITVAHELLHKGGSRARLEWLLTQGLLAEVCYVHWQVDHRYGHHLRVGTPEDPATAPRGMGAWRFTIRSAVGAYFSSWRLAMDGVCSRRWLSKSGRALTGLAFMAWAHALPAAIAAALFAALGPAAVQFFALQSVFAVLLLELVNYIEHYGLTRALMTKASAAVSQQSSGSRAPRTHRSDSTGTDSLSSAGDLDNAGTGEEGDDVDTWSSPAATSQYEKVGHLPFQLNMTVCSSFTRVPLYTRRILLPGKAEAYITPRRHEEDFCIACHVISHLQLRAY